MSSISKKLHVVPSRPVASQPSLFGGDETPVWPAHAVHVGQQLRELRNELNLTTTQAGARLGLDKDFYEALERGELSTNLEQAKNLMRVHP